MLRFGVSTKQRSKLRSSGLFEGSLNSGLLECSAPRTAPGTTSVNISASSPQSAEHAALRDVVSLSVRRYLDDLHDHQACDLYEVVLREVEAPLLREVLRHCEGNQSRAAATLGLNRATLRKKLRDHGLL